MDRKDIILRDIDRSGLGLEIGPSYNPVAPRSLGFRVEVVDHLDRAGLVAKYTGHGVDTGAIEEVDYVWHGEPLGDLVGVPAKYDWIIASHVIEHVPDLIGFLLECGKLLREGGVLSLALPDKRYCFDHLRPPSTTGEALQAHLEKRTRHAPGVVFDHFASFVELDGAITWTRRQRGDLKSTQTLEKAWQLFQLASDPGSGYIDTHAWRFTPSSFELMMSDLFRLGVMPLGLATLVQPGNGEIFATLRALPPVEPTDRVTLGRRINSEIADAVL